MKPSSSSVIIPINLSLLLRALSCLNVSYVWPSYRHRENQQECRYACWANLYTLKLVLKVSEPNNYFCITVSVIMGLHGLAVPRQVSIYCVNSQEESRKQYVCPPGLDNSGVCEWVLCRESINRQVPSLILTSKVSFHHPLQQSTSSLQTQFYRHKLNNHQPRPSDQQYILLHSNTLNNQTSTLVGHHGKQQQQQHISSLY